MSVLDKLSNLAHSAADKQSSKGSKEVRKKVNKASYDYQTSRPKSTSKPRQQATRRSYSWKQSDPGVGVVEVKPEKPKSEGQLYYENLWKTDPAKYLENIEKNHEQLRKDDGTYYDNYYQMLADKDPAAYLNHIIENGGTGYQSREAWDAENKNQHMEKRSLLSRIFGTMGYNGIVEGLYNITDDDKNTTFSQGLVEGAKNWSPLTDDVSDYNTFSDVLRNMGWEDNPNGKPNVLRGIVGFAGDVLLDPLTYLNPFSSLGKVAKGTGMTLEMAKEMKALSKAASVSDDIGRATKLSTAGGKLRASKVLNYDDVAKYVKEKNPHLDDVELTQKTDRLYNSYAKKIQGLRDLDEGADFGIGFSGLPFSSKIKVGDKTLDKFQKSFVKASDLRKFGDATIAPYYNSMMKKLRTTRIAGAVSKSNQMLRTAEKSNVFDAFKEFYLSDVKRGYEKAAKNLARKTQADELRELFKDFTDEDWIEFVDNHERGLHDKARMADEIRMKAEKKLLEESNLTKAEFAKASKNIDELFKRKFEMHDAIDSLYKELSSDESLMKYKHAQNMTTNLRKEFHRVFDGWYAKNYANSEVREAANLADEARRTADESISDLSSQEAQTRRKIGELQDSLDEVEGQYYDVKGQLEDSDVEADFRQAQRDLNEARTQRQKNDELSARLEDAVLKQNDLKQSIEEAEEQGKRRLAEDEYAPNDKNEYYSEQDAINMMYDADYAKEAGNEAYGFGFTIEKNYADRPTAETYKSIDQFDSLAPDQKEIVAKRLSERKIPTADGDVSFKDFNWKNYLKTREAWAGKGKKKQVDLFSEIWIDTKGNGYITSYDKQWIVDKINEFFPENKLGITAIDDDLCTDIYHDLLCISKFGDKYPDVEHYVSFFSNLREAHYVQAKMASSISPKKRAEYLKKLQSSLDKKVKEGKMTQEQAWAEWSKKTADSYILRQKDLRNSARGSDRMTQQIRDKINTKIDIEEENALKQVEKSSDIYVDTPYAKETFGKLSDSLDVDRYVTLDHKFHNAYAQDCYALFGKVPRNLNTEEYSQFHEMFSALNDYYDDDPIAWFDVMDYYVRERHRKYQTAYDDLIGTGVDAFDLYYKENDIYIGDMLSVNSDPKLTRVFKRFMEESQYDRMGYIRGFIREQTKDIDDAADKLTDEFIERIRNYNKEHNRGYVIIDKELEGFSEEEVEKYYRYFRNSRDKALRNLNPRDVKKLNKACKKAWDRKEFLKSNKKDVIRKNSSVVAYKEKPAKAAKKAIRQDAFDKVDKNIAALGKRYGFDNDEGYLRMAEDWEYAANTSVYDAELDLVDVMLDTIEYNREFMQNCLVYGGGDHTTVRMYLQKLQIAEERLLNYQSNLVNKAVGETVSDHTLREGAKELRDIKKDIRILNDDMKAEGVIFDLDPELRPLFEKKMTDLVEKQETTFRRVANYNKLRHTPWNDIEVTRKKFLGQNVLDAISDERFGWYTDTDKLGKQINSMKAEYDEGEKVIAGIKEESKSQRIVSDAELETKQKRFETAKERKERLEAERPALIEKQKELREQAKAIFKEMQNYVEDLKKVEVNINNANEFAEAYMSRLNDLTIRASKLPFFDDADISYIRNMLERFVHYIVEEDTKTARLNDLLGQRFNLDQEIDEAVEEAYTSLGNLSILEMATSDKAIAEELGITDDVMQQINKINSDEIATRGHQFFTDEYEQMAKERYLFGFLTQKQANAHNAGRNYMPRTLTESTKEAIESGELFKDIDEGGFATDITTQKNANKHRRFQFRKEGQEWFESKGLEGYTKDNIQEFLTYAINHNQLLHSAEINSIIKDTCTLYDGTKKKGEHIVASYVDVMKELRSGYKEAQERAMAGNFPFEYDSFADYLDEAIKKAGINKKLFTENVSYFEILPEQMDVLSKKFFRENKTVQMYNMKNEIFHTVNKFTDAQMKSMQRGLVNLFDSVQRGWKSVNTYINPGFHIQNGFSNAFSSILAIGSDAVNPAKLKRTGTIIRTRDPKQFINHPTYGKMTFKQIMDAVDEFGLVDNMFYNKDVMDKLSGIYNLFPFKLGNKMGTAIEGFQRIHLFISGLEQGKTFEEAAEMVDKFLFDYADLTHFEQTTLKRIIPFYTFMRKNLPLQFEMMMENPQLYLNTQKAFREIGEMAPEGDYVEENERNPWRQGDIQLPVEIAGRYYGIADQLPYTQLERILDPQKLLGQTSPWIKTPIELLATNTYTYTGMPVFGGTDEEGNVEYPDVALSKYVAQQIPLAKMFVNAGTKSGRDMDDIGVSAEEDQRNRYIAYILGQGIGFPINSVDRMYWYDDYGNWAANAFDKGLLENIRENRALLQ